MVMPSSGLPVLYRVLKSVLLRELIEHTIEASLLSYSSVELITICIYS